VNGPAPGYGPGALGGEHTDALLAELGYSAADTARLRAARVVTSEPV
jgi:crotonobetainyl-CoA:carnitine CoA-transferase CaiB-like acyl-CoA transferase